MEPLVMVVKQTLSDMIDRETSSFHSFRHNKYANPTFIPIHLTGGIGDVIMSLDAIRFLADRFDVIVYTHHIEAFRYFCKDIISFKEIPDFTWRLEFNTTARFLFNEGFNGFLVKSHEDLFLKQLEAFNNNHLLESIVRTHHKKFFLIAKYAKDNDLDRRDMPMHTLGFDEKFPVNVDTSRTFKDKIITIHDGFDIHNRSIVQGRATKTWDWSSWNKLVKLIKDKYPDYRILQLGSTPTARAIDGVTECLIDKTTISAAFDLLSRSSLHIDGDSGLVHAATRLYTESVVLWGPTPDEFYGYKQNRNLRSKACEGSCYGVKENWNDQCVLGYATPKCMDEISPHRVLEEIDRCLTTKNTEKASAGDIFHMPSTGMISSLSTSLNSWRSISRLT